MKRIAVLTSGGDAPGMNAAVRSVVRTGLDRGWEMFGVRHGYAGLIRDDFVPLGPRDVGGIIQHGGTMLGVRVAREFKTDNGQHDAIRFLRQRAIEALVVIGGDARKPARLLFPRRVSLSSASLRRLTTICAVLKSRSAWTRR